VSDLSIAPFPLDSYATELYERLPGLSVEDEQNGWAFLVLCGALGAMGQPLRDLIVTDDPDEAPWSPAFDVDRTPAFALPWLAQVVGERVPPGEAEDAARDRIRAPQGKLRGSLVPMLAAARKRLTGEKTVHIFEQVSSQWTITIVTRPSETPDAAGTLADMLKAKPAGLILTHTVTDLTLIEGLAGTIDALAGTIDAL
jgi:hypothetical protein